MNVIQTTPARPPLPGHRHWEKRLAPPKDQRGKWGWLYVFLCLLFLFLLVVWGSLQRSNVGPASAIVAEERVVPFQPAATPATQPLPFTNIMEMQPYRQTSSVRIRPDGGEELLATLVNLNPAMDVWYVLEITKQSGAAKLSYHLQNAKPHSQKLALDETYPSGILILEDKNRYPCPLFTGDSPDALDQARSSPLIYASLCAGRLYLRNPAKGNRTTLEAATEFLRDQVWGGEKVIILFHHLLQDSHRETAEVHASPQPVVADPAPGSFPLSAKIAPQYAAQLVTSPNLEITLQTPEPAGMRPGDWNPVAGNPGIFVSLLQPNFVAPEILQGDKALVSALDNVEASALCYLVAFDLDQFDLAYALGTDHPAVAWSDHIPEQARDPRLPGPDGIADIAPLVSTGLINPEDARATVAVFTAGFKRSHGAFKSGEFALRNHGTHYGFLENGVVFSSLQPGLATIFVRTDGFLGMQTWEESGNGFLPDIQYARQNGVPLVEFDGGSQSGVPGQLVNRWGPGNWSGSEDAKLRTMRSGLALQQNGSKRFLIYAVFTTATPSAMVRVFQAYQCRYAMLLDMNALEHTYLAVYRRTDSQLIVEHLISGMAEVDKSGPGGTIPRFLGFPDNRDFFYLMRRNR